MVIARYRGLCVFVSGSACVRALASADAFGRALDRRRGASRLGCQLDAGRSSPGPLWPSKDVAIETVGFGKGSAHGQLRRTVAYVGLPDLRGCNLVAFSIATILLAKISQEYFK